MLLTWTSVGILRSDRADTIMPGPLEPMAMSGSQDGTDRASHQMKGVPLKSRSIRTSEQQQDHAGLLEGTEQEAVADETFASNTVTGHAHLLARTEEGDLQAKERQISYYELPEESAVLHRSLHEAPKTVVRAYGPYLALDNGQTILDATGGAAVACLGHGNPTVIAAMTNQMNNVSYCHSLFFGTYAGEALAKRLIDSTEGKMSKAFIISSGSEAMESAVKMARQYFVELGQPQRSRFIARKQSYHGTTLGALGIGGHVARRAIFEPLLSSNVSHVSPCYEYRGRKDGESTEEYVSRLAQELDDEFRRVGHDKVCAFVAEPVVGAVGFPPCSNST